MVMKKATGYPVAFWIHDGGDEGDRTPDLLTASQALSQLSYAPVTRRYYRGMCSGMQELFWVDSRTYGFSWDGAEIITLRAIISIHRPDKTLTGRSNTCKAIIFIRRPDKTLMEQISDGGAGMDLDRGRSSYYVADAGVGQKG